MNVQAYIKRLGLHEEPIKDYEGLCKLIKAHLQTVPFENIDVLLGRSILIDGEGLFQKIISNNRGGYCFELNGLFGLLLDALGFERRPLMARVWLSDRPDVPPRTHTFNLVTLNEANYLVDVGFGGSNPRLPVPFKDGSVSDADGDIILKRDPLHRWMYARDSGEGAQDQFSFNDDVIHQSDLQLGNYFVSTHPESQFRKRPMFSRFTPNGRVTVIGKQFTQREGSETQKEHLQNGKSLDRVLREYFGIALNLQDLNQLWTIVDSVDPDQPIP